MQIGAGGMCQFCDLISCHRNMTRFHRSFSWDTNGLNSADWPEETLKSVEFRTLPAPSYYAENWRCTALHTSRLWWKKNEDNTVHELVPGLVCVEEKLDGKVFGVLLWEKCCLSNSWGAVGLFSAEMNENRELTKSCYYNLRDDIIFLFSIFPYSCLYKFGKSKRRF